MEVQKNTPDDIAKLRSMDRISAENAKLKASLDYVAMMSDVDIPTDEESEANTNEQQI